MNFSETLDSMEQMLTHASLKAESVSSKSIGWHLHHLSLTNLGVLYSLQKSEPGNFTQEKNTIRENVFGRGTILRGAVQAPDSVDPEDVPQQERIKALLEKKRALLSTFDTLHESSYFHHPFMGPLDKKASLEFMVIHNKHHLSIAEEILAAHR